MALSLLSAVTATGAGSATALKVPTGDNPRKITFYAYGTWGSGGSLDIEVSPDNTNWLKLQTGITADTVTSYDVVSPYVRGNVTAGTGFTLTLSMDHANPDVAVTNN
jgi:hypothetical protein